MGTPTGTLAGNTEFAGSQKLITITVPVAAASDVVTLTAAAHAGVVSIEGIVGHTITAGMDAAFTTCQVSYSGLDVTIVSKGADGAAATDFTGTTVEISLLIRTDSL